MFGLRILKGLALCFKQRLKLVLAIQKGLVLKVKVTNGYEKMKPQRNLKSKL